MVMEDSFTTDCSSLTMTISSPWVAISTKWGGFTEASAKVIFSIFPLPRYKYISKYPDFNNQNPAAAGTKLAI
jgi:hypothetical protein